LSPVERLVTLVGTEPETYVYDLEDNFYRLGTIQFITINFALKNCHARLELILTIKESFCCDSMLLFYGTVLKF